MAIVVDHVFICTAQGAPAAERLIQLGIREGSPNRHPGQGTACRRFYFENFMLELLWVEDEGEARSLGTAPTRLWERWTGAGTISSPFGVIVRPRPGAVAECPFEAWEYRPAGMPDLVLQIASGTGLDEPMWCYFEAGFAPADAPPQRKQPLSHTAGMRRVTKIVVSGPGGENESVTEKMAASGVIVFKRSPEHLLELTFDDGAGREVADLRPALPLVCRW